MSTEQALSNLLCLVELVRNRDDLPTGVREALTYNHRISEAYEAIATAAQRDDIPQPTGTPADWAYLAACIDAHADKFPVPDHMRLFIQPLRDLAEAK